MNYTTKPVKEQYLKIPSTLNGFNNTESEVRKAYSGRAVYLLNGTLVEEDSDRICPKCGGHLHINGHSIQTLGHLPIGSHLMAISFPRNQFFCPRCGHTHMQDVPFKAEHHRITKELEQYASELLATGYFTNKEVAFITGLGQNTVKAIDKRRLLERFTEDGQLKKPSAYATFLGIDEFKLHNSHQYATHIIDMATGHILWIAKGKQKQVVYDFIAHVGMEWMSHVKAVAMDMNADFARAFKKECPHIEVVFDHFHLVKNFNEKVVAEVRKAEEVRLYKEGKQDAAKSLKRSGRILTMSRKTLEKLDKEAEEGRVVRKGSELFGIQEYKRKGGLVERYEELIRENSLLTALDIVKCKLDDAYSIGTKEGESCDKPPRERMLETLKEICDICEATGNWRFRWFKRLIESHIDGLLSHTEFAISSGKIEGINNKIKTLRRQAYGYPDDEYFFLKLMDMSRFDKRANNLSHRICD